MSDPDRWADLRWLATADERLLWAILAATVLAAGCGAFVGWRARRRDQTPGR